MINVVVVLMLLVPWRGSSLSFRYDSFDPNMVGITFEQDAFPTGGALQLTKSLAGESLTSSGGRASYSHPVPLYDPKTRLLVDFTSSFSFFLNRTQNSNSAYLSGDGMAFFLVPFNSTIPANSSGGYLALFTSETAANASANCVVAVEFDTFQNDWDLSSDHMGINVNSIVSVANISLPDDSLNDGRVGYAEVTYNSTSLLLSVFLTYNASDTEFLNSSLVAYEVDLREILPESVRVGFAAGTGEVVEINRILSWSFDSTPLPDNFSLGPAPAPALQVVASSPGPTGFTKPWKERKRTGKALGLEVGLGAVGAVGVLLGCGSLCLVWFMFWRKRSRRRMLEETREKATVAWPGPKSFTYQELVDATNNFAEEGKLGEGGFGGVYKGWLQESNTQVAVKKLSQDSEQGKNEFVSEVKTISCLNNDNLVKLAGFCNEGEHMLLVYEFMPNGSLDTHLFHPKHLILPWAIRRKIALGLANAVLYLHQGWVQCIIHKDIKPSNVMLDSKFNTKLGDFGLARLVDHKKAGLDTTSMIVGTRGYMAPEYAFSGKAGKESDVFSFGVVALEICCGKRSTVAVKEESSKVIITLVQWVWELYGQSKILEAVDKALGEEFDKPEMERLMVIGLWCCHPNLLSRPSMQQAIDILNSDGDLPNLPPKPPVFEAAFVNSNCNTSTPCSSTPTGSSKYSFKSGET